MDLKIKNLKKSVILSSYTTLKVGGPAKYLIEVKKETDLIDAIKICLKNKINYIVIGEGSDLLVSDIGFEGLVIVNKVNQIKVEGGKFISKSGTNLQKFIDRVISEGYEGIEKMSGIPGTLGGAVYGNAGAYGQTISDHLVQVKIFDGKKIRHLNKKECKFGYRESIFKIDKFAILEIEFQFDPGVKEFLTRVKNDTLLLRQQKYPAGMRCPGSFYKNVIASTLSKTVLNKIPREKIIYGKVPAGYLMESVGANGAQKGDVKIADYHGNLIFNNGSASSSDFLDLANTYAKKIQKRFGIKLEPEVQLIGFPNDKKGSSK